MAKQQKLKQVPAETVTLIPEDPRDKFERLVTSRMNRVLNSIRLIGNLANPSYDWTPADLQAIRTAIADELNKAMTRFEKHKRGEKPTFKVPVVEKAGAD